MNVLLVLGGLIVLVAGGEAMIRGAVALGNRFHLPPMLIGIVIVGFGTSLPELLVSVTAVLEGAPELAVGNVIGSNISNVLLILGTTALIRPFAQPERALAPDGLVLAGVTIIVVLLGMQGIIPAWQGAIFLVVLCALLTFEYIRARRSEALRRILEEPIPDQPETPLSLPLSAFLVVFGIGGLIFGAELLIDGAIGLARGFGVSEGLIGLTVVAIGTSLPELAGAAVASVRGHSVLAYGNVVGSNMFNLLGILGVSSLVGPLTFPEIMVRLDGPVMIGATLLMLFFVSTKARLVRWEGALMLVAYFSYIGIRATMFAA